LGEISEERGVIEHDRKLGKAAAYQACENGWPVKEVSSGESVQTDQIRGESINLVWGPAAKG